MDIPTSRPQPQPSLAAMIVISLVIGGLGGGLVAGGVLQSKGLTSSTSSTSKQQLSVQEDSATVDVVKKTSPAVVSIIISKDYSKIYGDRQQTSPFDNIFGFPFSQQQAPQGKQDIGGGSGFIVSSDGMIVTNKHVVDDDQASYTVVMNDGKKYDAKVVAKDPGNDVAVLDIDAKDLPTLELADSNSVVIGQTVIAIGNALGEYRNTVTKGIVSGKSRTITASDSAGSSETLEDVFQTDAAINPGNSGGPLLDLTGHVIAINTAVNSQGQLIGFSIPVNVVKKDIDSVNDTGKITAAFLGVRYMVITQAMADQNKLPVNHGVLIGTSDTSQAAVVKDSPASKAGLAENDIIVAVNGTTIDDTHTLSGQIAAHKPGDEITLTIYHKGDKKDVKVTLEEKK